MLLWTTVILTVIAWTGIWVLYFRHELFHWLDNRFGPRHRAPKPKKPPRRRMYE